jgi:hypothetical protein
LNTLQSIMPNVLERLSEDSSTVKKKLKIIKKKKKV